MKPTIYCLLFLCVFLKSYSQHQCGTVHEPFEKELERRNTLQQIKSSQQYLSRISDATTYVPINMMLFGQNDGTGYTSDNDLNAALAELNKQFQPAGIEFYFAGTTFNRFPNSIFNFSNEDLGEFQDFHMANGATNAINIYLKAAIYINGVNYGGLSPLTPSTQNENRILIQSSNFNDDYVTSHEMGHFFGLYHTHFGPEAFGDDELVTRNPDEVLPRLSANCEDTVDYLCDTPADPWGFPDASVSTCIYTGTTLDLNGDTFSPSVTNVMSYYNCRTHTLTPGQFSRIQDGYLLLSNPINQFTLDAPETVQNAPDDVVATVTDYGFDLSWSDNSDTETGYIIERATSVDGPFIPIAGVQANTAVLANVQGISGETNYFRIKPSNSKSNYSAVSGGIFANFPCQNVDHDACIAFYTPEYEALRIEDFTLSKNGVALIENPDSGCSLNGQSNYYDTFEAVVSPGDVLDFNIKSKERDVTGEAYDIVVRLFADWNQDYEFNGPNELIFASPQEGTFFQVSGQFTVPMDIPNGSFRLRVGLSNFYNPIEPCWIAYGEMEDYKLTNELLAVGENYRGSLAVFPNPAGGTLNLQSDENVVFSEILITDVSGKTVERISGNARIIDTAKLASGLYIIQASSTEGKLTAKFIKQ